MLSNNSKGDSGDLAPSKTKNFILRTLSYVTLAPLCLFLLWKGGIYMKSLIILTFLIVLFEWGKLCFLAPFSFLRKGVWLVTGLLYMGIAYWTFWLFASKPGGNYLLMICIALVWASDTGGYLFGITLRGPKLAPTLSPNKTWAGSLGSLLLTWGLAHVIFTFTVSYTLSDLWKSALIAFPLSLVVQGGDLLESHMKRQFNVKDSGRLIPGHGGILDRLDGLLAVGFVLGMLHLFGTDFISAFTK